MNNDISKLTTIDWKDNNIVYMIDQNLLPVKLKYIKCKNYEQVAEAIETMVIRGAPAIGVAAAMGLALAAKNSNEKNFDFIMKTAAERLRETRPTAVNLFWAIDHIMKIAQKDIPYHEKRDAIIEEAKKMRDEDIKINMDMGNYGQELFNDGDNILTHCNAGGLATVKYGTALGVIRAAWSKGKKIHVYADETRPKLQGARLTSFELHYDGIPVTVITDNMAGFLMSKGQIDKIIVGADRIVSTGHVFNKIGTYSVAVLAKYHGNIPFYVAAPSSTFDLKKKYDEVIIEKRESREITHVGSTRIVPEEVPVFNPAFDMTPPELVTAIITEKGVIYPPYDENISKMID